MFRHLPATLAGLALLAPPAALSGQNVWLSATPPPAIRIVRETARFGTAAKHLANERAWVAALQSKKVPYSYVGTVAASGSPQFWFIGGASDFASLEELDQSYQQDKSLARQLDTLMAREAAFVTDAQTTLAAYRADLSYRPVFVQPETRHFWVTTFAVRPGQDDAFAGVLKAYAAAYQAAGIVTPWVTYEQMAGGDGPSYVLLMPLNSYGGLDSDLASRPAVGARIASPQTIAAQFSTTVVRMDTQLLTISPQISYVPDSFANLDKGFWRAK